jgi:hypothetical protein
MKKPEAKKTFDTVSLTATESLWSEKNTGKN